MPVYNVDSFKSQIAARGLASPNKFEVLFTSVPVAALAGGGSASDLNLMCEGGPLAGRNVQSLLDRQYGLNREIAYNGPTYTPLSLTFLCTSNYIEKRIFDRWNNLCVDVSKGFDVAYYQDYIGEMQVNALDVTGRKAFYMTYRECWPKTVAAIELNQGTQNAAVKLTVEMQYAYWESSDIRTNSVGTSVAPRVPASTYEPIEFDRSAHLAGATVTTYNPRISGHGGNRGHDTGGR